MGNSPRASHGPPPSARAAGSSVRTPHPSAAAARCGSRRRWSQRPGAPRARGAPGRSACLRCKKHLQQKPMKSRDLSTHNDEIMMHIHIYIYLSIHPSIYLYLENHPTNRNWFITNSWFSYLWDTATHWMGDSRLTMTRLKLITTYILSAMNLSISIRGWEKMIEDIIA